MDEETKLEKGMIVELKPGTEVVYPRALAGMRGVVRGLKEDDAGFGQAYIEWDKEHWRYNGEQDGWTFATHFRPVEGVEHEILGTEIHEVPPTPPRIPSEEEQERIDQYIAAIEAAFEKASESEAFFLITLKRDSEDDTLQMNIITSTTDEELKELPSSALLRFAEEEMRRKEEED